MADNVQLSVGTADGAVVATDDITSVHYQIVKLAFGALNTGTLVHSSEGLPVNIVAGVSALATAAKQDTVIGHLDGVETLLGTIDADTGNIVTAVQLIDDTVYVDDADWTDDTSKHLLVGGVYQATPHTVTDGDVTPFLTDVNGRLATVVSGTVAVSNAGLTELAAAIDTEVQVDIVGALPAGANTIGVVDLGATDNAVLDSIDADLTTIIGHVDGIEGLLTTIDGDTGNMATSLDLLDDTVRSEDTASGAGHRGLSILGVRRDADTSLVDTDGDYAQFQVNAAGQLKVEAFSGETLPVSVSGVATEAKQDDIIADTAAIEVATEAIQAAVEGTLTVAGTVDLGATDNAVLDAIAASVAAIDGDTTTIIGHVDGIEGLLTTIDADTGGILTATQLIDDAIYVDDADWTGDTSKHMLVGGVYMATQQAVTDGDVAPFVTDSAGRIRPGAPDIDITAHAKYMKKYYTSTGAATDGIIWSPAAGTRWHITTFYLNVSAAATVTIEDDKAGGDEAIWKGELAANSGVVMNFPPEYPWASGEDAADLIITTTAGNVYVTAVGWEV